jgi:protein-disulfide isomerase
LRRLWQRLLFQPELHGRGVPLTVRCACFKVVNALGFLAGVALLLGLAPTPAARADEPAITSSQANEIISELRAIRQLLEKGAPAATPAVDEHVSMALRDSPVLGNGDAPLTLIEFADFQCPFCRKFHTTVFEDIKKNFVDTGKLRYISRDLPLPMHDHATQAANAARCAGDQNQFWTMRHTLIVNSQKLERDNLLTYAHDLRLDMPAFTRCLDQNKYDAAIQRDAADAAQIGITGTPSFVLGTTVKDGRFQGTKIVGAQPYTVFDEKIRAMSDRH